MRTAISTDNPFGNDRYGFLWEAIRSAGRSAKHLDFGSYDGAVPLRLLQTNLVDESWAVDVVDIDELFREQFGQAPKGLHLQVISGDGHLPFAENTFASVSLLDVLEHVADQDKLLAELRRVLAPGGLLVVTVPQQHVFSFLDTGNWKFIFPNAHKWYYTRRHSLSAYHERYVDPSNGLIGDIEIEKSWHEHFTPHGLANLLRQNGFSPFLLDGAGLAARPIGLLKYMAPQPITRRLESLARWDARAFHYTHLFSASRKV